MTDDRVKEAQAVFKAAAPRSMPSETPAQRGVFRAKVFKSGNSLALRLPKALGLTEGDIMIMHKELGRLVLEPEIATERTIDLTGLYGAIPGLGRQPFDHEERGWDDERTDRG